MIEFAARALQLCSLDGPVQIHDSKSPLILDLRAHQVFLDAGKHSSQIQKHLKHRYPSSYKAYLFSPDSSNFCKVSLEEFSTHFSTENEILVIPAVQSDNAGGLYGIVQIIDRLLGPGGCPWDQAQTHETLKKNLIEEAYEVIEAIDLKDPHLLQEELGDLLLQPILHAQIEHKDGFWDIDVIATKLIEKLIRRHPHVFGEHKAKTAEEALASWHRVKQEENSIRQKSTFENIPRSMPAFLKASKVAQTAAKLGFEWEHLGQVFDKLEEETAEVKEAIHSGDKEHVEAEIGDLIYSIVEIARWQHVDPEEALRKAAERFMRRFTHMEKNASKPLQHLTKNEWLSLWAKAKEDENLA